MAQLVSVNLAQVMVATWKQDVGHTGIDKRPASGRVRVFDHHVDGDTIVDTRVHGGPDQAVYAYAREDAGPAGRSPGSGTCRT